jgi:GTP-binding protein
MISGRVAIVGRPNVGKSTIFNRIIGTRLSIVSEESGVTRDRIYGRATWLTRDFSIIDTGGIEIEDKPFQEQIKAQVEIAVIEADVIIMVCDVKTGVSADDIMVARLLQKKKKPIILAINKIDDGKLKDDTYEFFKLGLGDPILVSGIHGVGIGDLLDEVIKHLPNRQEEEVEGLTKFCIIGRPNVGKSSLVNAILNQDRVIVSEIEGTTRDAIDTPFVRDEKKYVVTDTAGLKKSGKIYEAVDKYAALRALSAIDRSDIAILMIDAQTGIREQDKNIAGYAFDESKPIIMVVNKWDAIEKDDKTMSNFTKKIREEFKFLEYAPIVYISAKNKSRIESIFEAIDQVNEATNKRIGTSPLNSVIMDSQMINPAPDFNGGRIKIKYANQVAVKPPTFVIFVNNPDFLHFSYKRFLENQIRSSFDFFGTPIKIITRKSE